MFGYNIHFQAKQITQIHQQPAQDRVAPSNAVLARFLREAQLTGKLDHPNIVPVYELGIDEAGKMFFTMKRVRGRSLAQLVTEGDAGSLVQRLDKDDNAGGSGITTEAFASVDVAIEFSAPEAHRTIVLKGVLHEPIMCMVFKILTGELFSTGMAISLPPNPGILI